MDYWLISHENESNAELTQIARKCHLSLDHVVRWNGPLLHIAFSIYEIMDTMTFNGQQITLECFSNSYEKMLYADNDHIMEVSI